MAVNCDISEIIRRISYQKAYGINYVQDEYADFVKSYLYSIGCLTDCVEVTEPCNNQKTISCSTFILPSFGFTHQQYGSSIDFIINPSDLNGVEPYTYSWTWDSQYFSIREVGSNTQQVLKLTKLQESNINMNYITNVSVIITDSNGCSFTKTCQFTYTKNSGVSNGALDCDEDDFKICSAPSGLLIINPTNTSFQITWNDVGFQYDVSVSTDIGHTQQIYHNQFGHPIITITGLIPDTTYYVRVINKSCNQQSSVVANTEAIPLADIDCQAVTFSPTNIFTGVAYTGTMVVPYLFGNGVAYSSLVLNNAGLTFTLPSGVLNSGSGNLIFDVVGVPTGNITLPITLFGNTCFVNKTVLPVCPDIDIVNVTIGTYNSFTNLYDVTISWAAVPNAAQYIIDDGTNIYTTTNTFFNFQVPPSTSFSGTVQSDCRLGSVGAEVPYEDTTPDTPCDLVSITTNNITNTSFDLAGISPSLLPGQYITWYLYDVDGPTPVLLDQGDTTTFPVTYSGLDAGVYSLICQKICPDSTSNGVGNNVTIVGEPDPPTVYVKFDYTMSTTVPSDTYLNPCDERGQHFDILSKPAIANVRTYSDPAGTVPLNVTGMGIVLNFQVRTKTGDFNCPPPGTRNTISDSAVPGTMILSGTSTPYNNPTISFEDSYGGAVICTPGNCVPLTWTQRLFEILPGTGYTII